MVEELGGTVDWSFTPGGCLAVVSVPAAAPALDAPRAAAMAELCLHGFVIPGEML
jgi:hypothetical protein